MTNKRRHKRVPLAATAAMKYALEESGEPVQVVIADISMSGLGVYSDRPLKEGTELSIEIAFISTEGQIKTASLRGEGVYVREMGSMYFMGIEFDEEINPQKQPFLHDHLQKILSWE